MTPWVRGSILVMLVLGLITSWSDRAAAQAPLALAINEDDSHFYMSRPPEAMSLEGLHAWVDQYANTKVSHLFLCPNAMKASYRSQVRDAIWDLGKQRVPEGDKVAQTWIDNARLLDERGLDAYAVWIARAREKKISPWLSMRMNDVHNVDDVASYIHSSFWVDHPDYWRVPGSKGSWVDRALDYGIPEVRVHNMAFALELLERYDPDGLELDWMRFGYHFKPGHEAEGCVLLTEFMRGARALTKEWSAKRGHRIKLGARVPSHPDAAKGLGMDAVAWVQEGLVDMLVPTPFWATADFDVPIELWRERIGPAAKQIVLAAGAEILLQAYPGAKQIENDITSARGFAAAHLHRGADQIYLFNYMDPASMQGGPQAYRTLLEKGLGPDEVAHAPRRHVITYRDTVPPGMSNNAQLPMAGRKGGILRVYIGPAPKQGRAVFVIGLAAQETAGAVSFDVAVNSKTCTGIADLDHPEQFPGVVRALAFSCPLDALKDGYNEVNVRQPEGQADRQIVWAEMRIEPSS